MQASSCCFLLRPYLLRKGTKHAAGIFHSETVAVVQLTGILALMVALWGPSLSLCKDSSRPMASHLGFQRLFQNKGQPFPSVGGNRAISEGPWSLFTRAYTASWRPFTVLSHGACTCTLQRVRVVLIFWSLCVGSLPLAKAPQGPYPKPKTINSNAKPSPERLPHTTAWRSRC